MTPLQQHVVKYCRIDSETGCWLWGGKKRKTYARTASPLGGAHRVAYAAFIGPIPAGLMVLHRCDVKNCCNPEHLFVGDNVANTKDYLEKGGVLGFVEARKSLEARRQQEASSG